MGKKTTFTESKWDDNGAADTICKQLFHGKVKKTNFKAGRKSKKQQTRKLNLVLNNEVSLGKKADSKNVSKKMKFEGKPNRVSPVKVIKNQNKDEVRKSEKIKKEKLKEQLKHLLQTSNKTETSVPKKKEKKVLTLREKMMKRLKSARFRFLNEQMYTVSGNMAQNMFKNDPDAFNAYHEGYRQQVKVWPLNPLDRIIKSIEKMPKDHIIADFGCGDAKLAQCVKQKVHSFDLIAVNEQVTACDMSKVPLDNSSVDVVVFCLSLMGTNLNDYILEANRVLKTGGLLKIAEVESRFENVENFIKDMTKFNFKICFKDLSHELFYFIDFKKLTDARKTKKLPKLTLQPCLYKKR